MKVVSAVEAIRAIPHDARVLLPHGAIEPTLLYRAFQKEHARFRNLQLLSGLQFGDYPFLAAGLGSNFGYTTWQTSPKLRRLMRAGLIEVMPLRYRDVTRVLSKQRGLAPDVVVVQTTLPRNGEVSLGIGLSFYRPLMESACVVIAEVNRNMPWTRGPTCLPVDSIDLAVESGEPLFEYRTPQRGARYEQVVEEVLGLIPAGAWVQFGIGVIPDSVLARLHEIPGANVHSGIVTEGVIDFVQRSRHRVSVITGEAAGTPRLYDFIGQSEQVEFQPVSYTHSVLELSRLPQFVSVNSAVEIDLQGQVNGEAVDGVQISGVGGSLDFIEGAEHSPGGISILALPATTDDGARSRIVSRFAAETPITIPRFCVDYVVTEYGAARLRGLTVRQRRDALIGIAHPRWRKELATS
jgi:4-hydroxybutyrate CoA-transferase